MKELGDWSWQQNPFVGTKPYQALLVILFIVDSSDLKNSNNSLYRLKEPREGAEQWYVVRDLGTAFGETGRLDPKRNDPDLFERTKFIEHVRDGFVEFGYHGWHQELFRNRITVNDVGWACDLLGRLSDAQWHDAFRAGGYEPAIAQRFIDIGSPFCTPPLIGSRRRLTAPRTPRGLRDRLTARPPLISRATKRARRTLDAGGIVYRALSS